jgi:hypothetical protein
VIKRYTVVVAFDVTRLESQVNDLLSEGWDIQGSMSVHDVRTGDGLETVYHQPMTLWGDL